MSRLLLIFCLFAAPLAAVESVSVEVRVGFNNHVFVNRPWPVTVRIQNDTRKGIALEVAVVSRRLSDLSKRGLRRQVQISAGVGKQLTFLQWGEPDLDYVVIRSDLKLPFRKAKERALRPGKEIEFGLAKTTAMWDAGGMLVMGGRARQIVGALPKRFTEGDATYYFRRSGGRELLLCALDESFAPDTWLAYSGFRTLIWTEPDLSKMPDPAQLRAILKWVEYGGRLVILSAHRPAALDQPELKALLPVAITGTRTVPYYASWWVSNPAGVDGVDGTMLEFELKSGRDPWVESMLPAKAPVIAAALGDGEILICCFDPLAFDRGSPRLLRAAMDAATGRSTVYLTSNQLPSYDGYGSEDYGEYYYDEEEDEEEAVAPKNQPTGDPLGTDEGPFQALNDEQVGTYVELVKNNNLMTPSLGLFIFVAVLFLILIGPGDYFLLKRFKLLRFSVLSLLIYTFLFSGVSLVATWLMFAPSTEVNRFAVLDFTEDSKGQVSVHGMIFHGSYSATGDSYLLEIEGYELFGRDVTMGEHSFNRGGGDTAQVALGPGRQPALIDQPFNSFRGVHTMISGKPTGSPGVRFVTEAGKLYLEVYNGLPGAIETCIFVWRTNPERVYGVEVGALNPGETRRLGVSEEPPGFPRHGVYLSDFVGRMGAGYHIKARRGSSYTSEERSPGILAAKAALYSWYRDNQEDERHGDITDRLGDRFGLLIGITDMLPFDDGVEEDGFSFAVFRKRVRLPDELRQE